MSTALIPDTETSTMPKLEEILSPDSSESKEPFIVDSPEKAAWAARKIMDAESRIEQYTEQSKQYKNRIDSWFTKAVQDEIESVNYLKVLIRPFIEHEVSIQSKRKTIRYPGLNIQLRKKPDRIDITDKEIAMSFCEANHTDAIIIKKELSKTYLKDLLTKKGEIIPGTTMVPGNTELYFKDE
jgi:hypothetical protein